MSFWIEIEVNEETAVSVLLTRWIGGGVHLNILSQTSSSFFSVFPVYRIFLLCSPVSGDFQKPAQREDGANFKAREKSILFFCVYSRQNFSLSQLL